MQKRSHGFPGLSRSAPQTVATSAGSRLPDRPSRASESRASPATRAATTYGTATSRFERVAITIDTIRKASQKAPPAANAQVAVSHSLGEWAVIGLRLGGRR